MDAKRPDEIVEEMGRQRRKDLQARIFLVVMLLMTPAIIVGSFIMSIIG